MEDHQIVDLFLARDEQALAETQKKYGTGLRCRAYEITGDWEEACECENDTYRNAWNSIPPHTPHDYLYAFLMRIDRNLALNICRKKQASRRKAVVEELTDELLQVLPGGSGMEDVVDDMTLKQILNDFLGNLEEERRNLFIRRYWYLDSIETIAKGYGLTESKVKTTLFRCRNELRKCLEKEGYWV